MRPSTLIDERGPEFEVYTCTLRQLTRHDLEFIDLTEAVARHVERSGIESGTVNIQTRHTTTAIVVNEHEPLLLDDLKELLRRTAPRDAHYRHDDFDLRRVNLLPGEPANGHSHARAMMLGTSECLNIVDGRLALGRWQRIFLVELDGPRERLVSINMLGVTAGTHEPRVVPGNGKTVEHAAIPGAA